MVPRPLRNVLDPEVLGGDLPENPIHSLAIYCYVLPTIA